MNGFFQLQRRFFNHELWTEDREFSRAEAFLDLLQLAAFTHSRRIVKGSVVELKPGQLCGSIRYLSERWKWSIKRVRTYLDLLEAERMLAREKAHTGTVITLVNYGKYAQQGQAGGTPKAQTGHTEGTPRAQIEEGEQGANKDERERAARAHEGPSLNSMQILVDRVNSLRPEWKRIPHFTAAEMHALSGAAQAIQSLTEEDLEVIRRFLAYKPRGEEKLWQVKSRERFMSAPADVLTTAEEWARRNGGTPSKSTGSNIWK